MSTVPATAMPEQDASAVGHCWIGSTMELAWAMPSTVGQP